MKKRRLGTNRITKYGTFKGGVCEKVHEARAGREEGAKMYLQELEQRRCLQANNGWYRVVKLPKIPSKKIWHIGAVHGASVEVGYWRCMIDVVKQLYEQQRAFRMSWLEKWAEDIASFEFGICPGDVSNDLEAIEELPKILAGKESKMKFGYAPPHRDDIYQQKKANGVFATI